MIALGCGHDTFAFLREQALFDLRQCLTEVNLTAADALVGAQSQHHALGMALLLGQYLLFGLQMVCHCLLDIRIDVADIPTSDGAIIAVCACTKTDLRCIVPVVGIVLRTAIR